jgi:hypothetical protein
MRPRSELLQNRRLVHVRSLSIAAAFRRFTTVPEGVRSRSHGSIRLVQNGVKGFSPEIALDVSTAPDNPAAEGARPGEITPPAFRQPDVR